MDKQERLEQLSRAIAEKKAEITELVEVNEYTKARREISELKRLNKQFGKLKGEIRKESITEEDVQKLRSIEPHRKSVQNMTDLEVAQTPKFEKLLYTELGEKSPYEMRNGNTDWRNDTSQTVQVVNVQKRDIPDNLGDLRKDKTIPRSGDNEGIINLDTGIKIVLGQPSINESVSKAIPDDKRGVPVAARMSALYQLKDIIENAICFDSQISEYNLDTAKNKIPNTLFMHKLYGVIKCNGEFYLADLSVEEFFKTDKEERFEGTQNRLYCFRDIKIAPLEALRIFSPAVPNKNVGEDTSIGAIISIPRLYEIVKTYDKSFFENPNAPGREEREVEQYIGAKFDDAKAELKTGNPTSAEKDKQISHYAKSRGITDAQAAEELTQKAERFKEERDILRGKIDEVNDILMENPALMEEYRAKRDEHRERQKSKSTDDKSRLKPTKQDKPNGSKH